MAAVVRAGYEELLQSHVLVPYIIGSEKLPTVSDLLRQMETHRVEFKQTARVPVENDVPERVVNEGVVKSVSAFLNSEGGTLGIGITDDGDIVGIQPDLDYKNQDLDGYQNWLGGLLVQNIGGGAIGAHVRLRVEPAGGQLVVLIDVSPSLSPVYAKTTKGDQCFFVRIGNATRMLEGPEIQRYIAGRWPSGT